MKRWQIFSALFGLATLGLIPVAIAQDNAKEQKLPVVDGSELDRQLIERLAKIEKLSHEEQAALREARIKADADPAVREAVAKRNDALREFRVVLEASMIKSDPEIAAILAKLNAGVGY